MLGSAFQTFRISSGVMPNCLHIQAGFSLMSAFKNVAAISGLALGEIIGSKS
jgi:hypothetical protein